MDDIAAILKISPKTLDRRLSDDDAVREAYDRGRASAKKFVVDKLFEQIEKGKMSAIIFYLKTQCGWRETEQTTEQHTEVQIYLPEKSPAEMLE